MNKVFIKAFLLSISFWFSFIVTAPAHANDQEAPLPVFGLKVSAYKTSVIIKWNTSIKDLEFIIEASKNQSGPFNRIKKTAKKQIVFSPKSVKKFNWFRVVSVNKQGIKSIATRAVEKIEPKQNKKTKQKTKTKAQYGKIVEEYALPYKALLLNDPKNVQIRMQLGILYSRFGQYDTALKYFDGIAIDDVKNTDALVNKGNIYLAQRRYKQAIFTYLKAKWINPDDANIHINMALAFYGNGDLENAKKSYKLAIKLDPLLRRPYRSFVRVLVK